MQEKNIKTLGKVINELPYGKFTTLKKIVPCGALQARKQKTGGVSLYWRYSIGTTTERVPIGFYDSSAPPKSLSPTSRGFSIAAATLRSEHLASEHVLHREQGGRPALLIKKAEEKAALDTEARRNSTHTLQSLLEAYAEYLKATGRISHNEVRSVFYVHITEPWPEIAALPAAAVTTGEIIKILRRIAQAGKGRTANKVRSYLHSAFQVAKTSKTRASIPEKFEEFCVNHNPVADTSPDASQNQSDKNPLSLDELRMYWSLIKVIPGFKGAVLQLHLLTGGQRIAQLVRLLTNDIQAEKLRLYDPKGRSGRPARQHDVVLIKPAQAALAECVSSGKYALSTDGGHTHLSGVTLSNWACEAAVGIPGFRAKRLRSGVETLLAKLKVSTDVRAHLQSHGLGGIQARHYDGHDYLEEMHDALTLFHHTLDGTLQITKKPNSRLPTLSASF